MDNAMTSQSYAVNMMDTCSYCEIAMDGIMQSIERGDYDGAFVRLSSYLLEMHARWMDGRIKADLWHETLRFYRRMVLSICTELQAVAD